MTDRRYEDDGGRPYVAPENPDAADEAREMEDERETRLLREEIDNALEILDGYFEVNNGINEIGVAAMRLIQHAPEMLAAFQRVKDATPKERPWLLADAFAVVEKVTGGHEADAPPRYVCAACGRTSPSPDALTAVADPTTSYCGCGWIGGQG